MQSQTLRQFSMYYFKHKIRRDCRTITLILVGRKIVIEINIKGIPGYKMQSANKVLEDNVEF